uniref:SGL domain-containing protein n=1 Tax=Bursaphelenchus xylophilus TaxID=6326 RepID=A0A1I7SVB2_BURXY
MGHMSIPESFSLPLAGAAEIFNDLCGRERSDLNNASNATAGALSVWRVNDGMANELSFSGKTPPTFNPYGISVFASTVFVINSRRGRVETDSVEVLEIKDGRLRRKRKPVASKHFTSLVNVVGLSSTEFYASNQYIYRNPYMQWIEFGGHFKSGAVYYFDGRLIHPAIKKLKQPAGMARDGNKLYVAEFGGNAIQIYDINDFKTPRHLETINLLSAPFSIAMELRQSALTVSTHPLKLRFLAFQAYPEEFLSPSNVIRVKQRKNKTWQFTQFYCNDGATIRGVVTAMRIPDNRIVMGNVNRGLLKCQLNLT